MAVSVDKSEGTRFVRYSSDDSREAVEKFVAEHDLVVDWPRAFASSTGVLEGRRIELIRLPIVPWFVAGGLPDGFATSSLLRPLEHDLEGDGFFRVLVDDLEAGHDIQSVTFANSSPERLPYYSFFIARLGVPTLRQATAGGLAVESLLARRRQRMENTANEGQRVAFLLERACEPIVSFASPLGRRALAVLADQLGGPRSGRASSRQPESESVSQDPSDALAVLKSAVRVQVAGLTLDLRYRYQEAAAIVDDALSRLVRAD